MSTTKLIYLLVFRCSLLTRGNISKQLIVKTLKLTVLQVVKFCECFDYLFLQEEKNRSAFKARNLHGHNAPITGHK